MSIKGEINRINQNIEDSYIAVSNKGAVMPIEQNSNNLANTINSIGSDATALADEIFKDETAYIGSGKVTGTFDLQPEVSAQDQKIADIKTALQGKVGNGGNNDFCVLKNIGYQDIYLNGTSYDCQIKKNIVLHNLETIKLMKNTIVSILLNGGRTISIEGSYINIDTGTFYIINDINISISGGRSN